MSNHRRLLTTLSTAVALGVGAGCGKPFNQQIDLTGSNPLPALSRAKDTPPLESAPSVQGFDRRGWELVRVEIPIRQVEHYPTYVSFLKTNDPVWTGSYATAHEALDDGARPGPDAADAVMEPFFAAGLLLWAPIDMIINLRAPWNLEHSPTRPYERIPHDEPDDMWHWIEPAGGPPSIEWHREP